MRDRGRNRARPNGKATLLSALLAAIFVACTPGASTPTGAPTPGGATPVGTQPATVTPAPTTAVLTPVPPTAAPPVVTPAPTIAGDVDLEELIPTEVGGITLTSETVDIGQFMGAYETFSALLGVLGKSPDDVTIVQAQGSNQQTGEVMIVQAFRFAGADAAALMNGFLEFWKVDEDVASPTSIGGKQLIVQGHPDTEAQYKSYYYGYGDIVFRLGYNGDNFDEMMAELVSKLP